MRPPLSTILAARSACAALAIAVMLAWATAGSAQAAPAVAAGGPLRVLPGSGSTFPSRSLVLMVPGRRPLAPSPVSVLENGRPVGPTVVTSIGSAGANDFGVVLAIDVSPSMSGASLEHATQAARTLARRRVGAQQLGVIDFDSEAKAVLPLTTDAAAISRALAHTPHVGPGTHIYDALALALAQLQSQQVAAGAVIVISDGADRGSVHTEAEVAAIARAHHISLYAVGVRDGAFAPQSLRMLAHDGGGEFLETRSSRLGAVLAGLSSQLTSRYVIHYRSQRPLGKGVVVQVRVAGVPGAASFGYRTPPAPVPGQTGRERSFWSSSLALMLAACAAAVLFGLALAAYLGPRSRRATLRARVAAFTALPAPGIAAGEAEPGGRSVAERVLSHTSWWPRLKEDMAIARIERAPDQVVTKWAAGTVMIAILVGIAVGPVLSLAALVLGPLTLRERVRHRLRKQRKLFADQLPVHLQELASTMRAGHSLVAGIAAMARAAEEPSKAEWARVVADEQLGKPLEAAMAPVAKRMASTEMQQVALVATLHSRTGGNMAEVIERVADGVRERAELRRELDSLTAQARISRRVVTLLPPCVAGLLYLINPTYMRPLINTTGGQIVLAFAGLLVIAGSLIMRKITDIAV